MLNEMLIHICNRDRPTELALLLQSLRTQSYQNFNILILDDGSGTNIQNYYFLNYIINRIKQEGHDVVIIRNDVASGVSKARQQLIDFSLKHRKEKYYVRIDDDSILDSLYLEKLLDVIQVGYDVASGLVPSVAGLNPIRDISFVKPIIGYCELNNKGELVANFDDCSYLYNEETILPSPHFRSCALFKKEIFENDIDYNSRLSKNGFREEQILSWKIINKGYKIGIHTGALAWHMNTPSGGERDTMNLGQFNQEQFEITTKRMFEEYGDFLSKYYKSLGVNPRKLSALELMKSNNLVSKKVEVGIL